MKNKAIIFMDYNGTFDDVCERKGGILFSSLRHLCRQFDNNLEIVIITAADLALNKESIKPDISMTLSYFPKDIRPYFKYLIEGGCRTISEIKVDGNKINFTESEALLGQKPKDFDEDKIKQYGVEKFMQKFDGNDKVTHCIFVGDSEIHDLAMLDSNIGNREKISVIANRRILKADSTKHKVLRLSMSKNLPIDVMMPEYEKIPKHTPIILKTSYESYGVGRGLYEASNFIESKKDEKPLNK